jgi:inner membrane transporter RhtA
VSRSPLPRPHSPASAPESGGGRAQIAGSGSGRDRGRSSSTYGLVALGRCVANGNPGSEDVVWWRCGNDAGLFAVSGGRQGVPAQLLVLGAAFSVQGGAAVAKSLLPTLGPAAVVFLRLAFGSLALWAIGRPRLGERSRGELGLVVALGFTLVGMNLLFYESLERLPLGVAVTVEFVGPLVVAVLASRRLLDGLWIALAALGIALLADGGGRGVQAAGLVFAVLAGICWGLYIILGTRVGRIFPGSTGLAPAMAIGALVALPWGVLSAGHHLRDPQLVGAGVGVGLLCSALPWSLEFEAMRRLPTQVFGVLMSLEPAVAALAGFVLLGEHLRARAWVALVLVVVASAGASRRHGSEVPLDA